MVPLSMSAQIPLSFSHTPDATRPDLRAVTVRISWSVYFPNTESSCGTRDHVSPSGEVHTAALPMLPNMYDAPSRPTATRPGPATITSNISWSSFPPKTDSLCGMRDQFTPSTEVHTAASVSNDQGSPVFSAPTATKPGPPAVALNTDRSPSAPEADSSSGSWEKFGRGDTVEVVITTGSDVRSHALSPARTEQELVTRAAANRSHVPRERHARRCLAGRVLRDGCEVAW